MNGENNILPPPQRDQRSFGIRTFRHDTDFRNNPQLRILRKSFGDTDAYAVVNMLFEVLARARGNIIEFSPDMQIKLAADFGVMKTDLINIITEAIKKEVDFFQLYEENGIQFIASTYLDGQLKSHYWVVNQKRRRREKDRKRMAILHEIHESEFIHPKLSEVVEILKEQGYGEDEAVIEANRFYKSWEGKFWTDERGYKLLTWKKALKKEYPMKLIGDPMIKHA